jgi:hypothetical protein
VLGDQIDEHAEERDRDHEHDPRRLLPPPDVVTTKDVGEDRDRNPNPDTHAKKMIRVQRMSRNG